MPRLVVVGECHRMLERGETDAAIAAFIREHVKIVLVSKEECERLDRRDQLGLRQAMPSGWALGDDLFARLAAAGIEWDPVVPGSAPGSEAVEAPQPAGATGVGAATG